VSPDHVVPTVVVVVVLVLVVVVDVVDVVDVVVFVERASVALRNTDDDNDILAENGAVGNVVNPRKLSLAVAKARNVVTIVGSFFEIRFLLLQ
jgi:hypothetical protein